MQGQHRKDEVKSVLWNANNSRDTSVQSIIDLIINWFFQYTVLFMLNGNSDVQKHPDYCLVSQQWISSEIVKVSQNSSYFRTNSWNRSRGQGLKAVYPVSVPHLPFSLNDADPSHWYYWQLVVIISWCRFGFRYTDPCQLNSTSTWQWLYCCTTVGNTHNDAAAAAADDNNDDDEEEQEDDVNSSSHNTTDSYTKLLSAATNLRSMTLELSHELSDDEKIHIVRELSAAMSNLLQRHQ